MYLITTQDGEVVKSCPTREKAIAFTEGTDYLVRPSERALRDEVSRLSLRREDKLLVNVASA